MLSENTNGYMFIQIKSFNVIIDVEALNLLNEINLVCEEQVRLFCPLM